MRIFFSVGEPSGDLHGANLIKDLRRRAPEVQAVGFGGPKMAEAGCGLVFDLTSLAVMGLWNVLINARKFFAVLAMADQYFAENKVDAVVLIDFPGFNWWIARKARKHNVKVFYYGVPQMWAWLPWRVHKLRRLVDHALCKLPFEVPWFEKRGCQASFVGHPYFDELIRYQYDEKFISREFAKESTADDEKLLVLLPGSRTQEVRRNLPWLLESAQHVRLANPRTRVAIGFFRESHVKFADDLPKMDQSIEMYVGRTPELIRSSDACIACSGSVSLELLHHRKPTVIVYRVSLMVMLLQFVLLRTRFITLVNMLGLKRIEKSAIPVYDPNDRRSTVPMPEYLRWRNCSADVAGWVNDWFADPMAYGKKVAQLDELANQFAHSGASERAAEFVIAKLASEHEKETEHLRAA